ncbi:MAG: D-2-hydroxyacid dehydrogenase [Clostridia bacterium]|jgi:phosphoglycerate dehydrogenase-like enzyme|nr:D-2-hydroxyacid dehydrogenase [Clostridia bacterium]
MKKTILVLFEVNEQHKKLLESRAPGADFIYAGFKTVKKEQIQKAQIILGNPPAPLLQDAPNLEWLQLRSAGVGAYAEEHILSPKVILTNMSGAYGLAISEYMLGVLLEMYNNLHFYRDQQAQSKWSYLGNVRSVHGSVALVLGVGDIGGQFAEKLKCLGAYTIGVRRKDADKPAYLDELHFMEQLEDLLPRADIVSLSLPETKLTQRIINRETLALMKKDAVLINIGRGSAVDTEALCDALEAGQLLGAALDVIDPEPLPEEHRLWKIKNAVITPHASGRLGAQITHDNTVNLCVQNLEAYINGLPLINVVDRTAGY